MPGLLCLDFDDTLVNGHFHSSLNFMRVVPNISASQKGPFIYPDGVSPNIATPNAGASQEQISMLINDCGCKNKQELRDNILKALDSGTNVAITSFTHYPEVVKPTLEAILGEEYKHRVNEIKIIAGFPSNGIVRSSTPGFVGKKEHLDLAMRSFGMDPNNAQDRKNTLLVDDSSPNVDIAKRDGFSSVQVPKQANPTDKNYLSVASKFIQDNAPNVAAPKTQRAPVVMGFTAHKTQENTKNSYRMPNQVKNIISGNNNSNTGLLKDILKNVPNYGVMHNYETNFEEQPGSDLIKITLEYQYDVDREEVAISVNKYIEENTRYITKQQVQNMQQVMDLGLNQGNKQTYNHSASPFLKFDNDDDFQKMLKKLEQGGFSKFEKGQAASGDYRVCSQKNTIEISGKIAEMVSSATQPFSKEPPKHKASAKL
jgi:hypothetical protein